MSSAVAARRSVSDDPAMRSKPAARGATRERRTLMRAIGTDVSRFQEATYAFDQAASEILALSRSDLPCLTMLLFSGAASVDELAAALHRSRTRGTSFTRGSETSDAAYAARPSN
jgi:hypothetical protein